MTVNSDGNLCHCPRCGERGLEFMKTYSFCWECGYFPGEEDRGTPIPNFKKFNKEKNVVEIPIELEATAS